MRLLSWAITAATAVSSVLALDKASSEYAASLAGSNGIITLNDQSFEEIVGNPHDYNLLVLLTAEGPQYGCSFCKVISGPYDTIARSWKADHPKGDGLIFAIADIANVPKTYGKLELTHAPNLWIYKATDKKTPIRQGAGYEVYQFPAHDSQVEPLVNYLKKYNVQINIREPFKWDKLAFTLAGVAAGAVFLKATWQRLLAGLQKKQVWSAVTLVSVLMFIAGHMFNMIRRTPYVLGDGKGGVTYFVGGYSNQIGVETQIIALVYAILSFCSIALVIRVPKIKGAAVQSLAVYFIVIAIFLTYSFLLSKFKIKNGGYPFGLLDIF